MRQIGIGILAGMIGVFLWLDLNAQADLKIKVIDQYETPVPSFNLIQSGSSQEYSTNKEGFATVKAMPGENLLITGPVHDTVSFVYEQLPVEKKVVL